MLRFLRLFNTFVQMEKDRDAAKADAAALRSELAWLKHSYAEKDAAHTEALKILANLRMQTEMHAPAPYPDAYHLKQATPRPEDMKPVTVDLYHGRQAVLAAEESFEEKATRFAQRRTR